MIDLSQELILSLIIKAFLTGVVLGLLYEAVRIAKMLLGVGQEGKIRRIISFTFLFCTDIAFCLLFASSAILLTYNIGGGVFRGCVYLAMGGGLMLYRLTVGKLTEKPERAITTAIKKTLRKILKVALVPIRAIFSLYCRLYSLTIGRIIGKIISRMMAAKKAQTDNDAPMLPQVIAEEMKDEEKNAKGARGYRKEGRISFTDRRRGDGGRGGAVREEP